MPISLRSIVLWIQENVDFMTKPNIAIYNNQISDFI